MTKSKAKQIVKHFYEAGTLRKIPRSHMQTLLSGDLADNIASHTFRVCLIGLILANLEKVNPDKVLQMCLFHDFSESRCGDQNWVHKRYVHIDESLINKDQFKGLPDSQNLIKLTDEYNQRITKEANIAKDADRLDQTLLEREYVHMGNLEAKTWGRTNRTRLYSKSTKQLLKEIVSQTPSDWWTQGLWTDKRR